MFEHPKGKVATFSVNNFHSNRTLKISDIFSPSGSKSTKHIENTPSSFSELKKILHNGFDSVRKVTPHRIIIDSSPSHSIKDPESMLSTKHRLNLRESRISLMPSRNNVSTTSGNRIKKQATGISIGLSSSGIPENLNEKIENETSTRNFPSFQRSSVAKNPSPDHTLEILKHSQKLKHMFQKQVDGPSVARSKISIKLLSLLSTEEGQYTEDMQIIVKELRKAIFCLSKEVIDKIEELTHQSIFTAEKNTVTYFELTNLLINHIEKTKHEKIEYMEQERKNSEALKKGFFERETELQNEINDKDSVYSSKIRRLEYEIRELNDQLKKAEHENSTLLAEYQDITDNLATNDSGNNKAAMIEFVDRIKSLTLKNLELEDRYARKSEALDEMKYSFKNLIENYKSIAVKMKFSKEMTEKMESQIKDLTQKGLEKANKNHHENTVFTPRPSLGPLINFFQIPNQPTDSTQDLVRKINNIIENRKELPDDLNDSSSHNSSQD